MKQAKNLEPLIHNWFIERFSLSGEKLATSDDHISSPGFSKMLNFLEKEFSNKKILRVTTKPNVKDQPSYGNKVESKTDLIVYTENKVYRISVKKDTAKSYVHSSGSFEYNKEVFLGGNLREKLSEEFSCELEIVLKKVCQELQNFESIPKGRNIEEHVNHVLETRGFTKQQVLKNPKTSHKFEEVRRSMIFLYQNGISNQEKNYKQTLKNLELELKTILWRIFNESDKVEYSRSLLFEMITGQRKFGALSLSTAEYILNCDGFFHIDSPDCEYITKLIKCFHLRKENSKGLLGRLQNVPRQGISKDDWINKQDPLDIASKSATADLSIKI